MDLGTGEVVTRLKLMQYKMTILSTEYLVDKEGIKILKFYNKRCEYLVPTANDPLEGVGEQQEIKDLLN